MVKNIYKYNLEVIPSQEIELPILFEPLSIGVQLNLGGEIPIEQPVLWAMVNPEAAKQKVKIRMIMTGEDIENNPRLQYLGTITLHPVGYIAPNGIVLHYFIELEN